VELTGNALIMRLRLLAAVLTLATAIAVAAAPAGAREGSRFRPAVSGELGVVATESPAAARVGRRVLERGGNAVDAAVSTVFAIGVARPQSCGIGGGGFMVYRSRQGRTAALDFREEAPAAFGPETLQGPGLHEDFTGHLTVGVPGTVAGMRSALRRYGTISLPRAIAPAVRLARDGFSVPPSLSEAMAENADRLKLFPAAARQYLVNGETPYPPGSLLRQPDMARSLAAIARRGPRAFYRGRIARLIDDEMDRTRQNPIPGDAAVLTADDLAAYRARWRRPLAGSFRRNGIVAMPPPTSGGVAVIEMLNLLEGFDLRSAGQSSADALHLIAESQKIAWADRNEYLADPDFVRQPVDTLTSKQYASRRRAEIDPAHAKDYAPGLGPFGGFQRSGQAAEPGTTTHLSVIDRNGNAVGLTCTIEQEFGSAVVAPGTGFLLNNELTDFGAPGTANEARAGKRPRSSMSPTIATREGRPILVTGGAGGSRIIMGVLLTALNRLEFGLDIAHAVDAERLDAQQGLEGPVLIEDARIDPAVLTELERRGHTFTREGEYAERPRVQAAGYAEARGSRKEAVTDPRSPEAGSLAERP
jgi:gamma-glutamyltranspeptidase/glutathione hydrolase